MTQKYIIEVTEEERKLLTSVLNSLNYQIMKAKHGNEYFNQKSAEAYSKKKKDKTKERPADIGEIKNNITGNIMKI